HLRGRDCDRPWQCDGRARDDQEAQHQPGQRRLSQRAIRRIGSGPPHSCGSCPRLRRLQLSKKVPKSSTSPSGRYPKPAALACVSAEFCDAEIFARRKAPSVLRVVLKLFLLKNSVALSAS